MVTKQLTGAAGSAGPEGSAPDAAAVTRADSLAREIFSDIANKWALLIIEALGGGTLRFTELRAEVEGISHKMLTQNLRLLERNGLLVRTVHPTVPPRVEYTLTEPGHALRATVDAMCAWTQRYLGEIESARDRFDDA
ncbi:helix-turn-helix domain-containing protein [Streptomyces sp. NPDC097619]|uniref:winged helix-turn-helix transcriptional regulator n=1 Tax=Streptomyces sp. NPDC097619 TaxID=3157228 RepID=UPI003316B8FB